MSTPLHVKINDPSKFDNEDRIHGLSSVYIGSRYHPKHGYIGTIIIEPLGVPLAGDETLVGEIDLPAPFIIIDSDGATISISHGDMKLDIGAAGCYVEWDGVSNLRVLR